MKISALVGHTDLWTLTPAYREIYRKPNFFPNLKHTTQCNNNNNNESTKHNN